MKSKIKYILRLFIKDIIFYNLLINSWIRLFGTRDKRQMKYNISLCLIFNNEALFLKEWIDYHRTIGIDHFYLYNNNSTDNYKEVLQPYLNDDIVTLIEWPGKRQQFIVYNHCYDTFRDETNWLSFLDADEFFVPKYVNTIKEWIEPFSKYPAIMVNWLMFGTGGIIKHDYSQNVIEQYTSCSSDIYHFGKCILNTRFDIADFNIWHVHHHTYMKYRLLGFNLTIPAVNQFKHIYSVCSKLHIKRKNQSTMNINHYFTKAWDIYNAKRKKSDVLVEINPKIDYSYFYKFEDKCIDKDYTILKFIIRMKMKQGLID